MEITVTELPGPLTFVTLDGRLDAPGSDKIALRFTAALAAQGRDAVVDLSGVSFIASMGIRMLISGARGLAQKGRRVVMFGANEMVQGVFDDAALDQILTIVATRDEALAQFAS